MKFKAYKEQAGTWFVNTHKVKGEQRGSRFESELQAKQYALTQSISYYQLQLDKGWLELQSISKENNNGEVYLEQFDCYSSLGDLLA